MPNPMLKLKFLKTALQYLKSVGALFPSSKYVARKIIAALKPECKYIVEYGGGDVAVTKELVRHLASDGRIAVIELNKRFAAALKEIKDDRLSVIEGDVVVIAKNLAAIGLPRIDAVISSMPFSFLGGTKRNELIRHTARSLRSGGTLIIYHQYTPLSLGAVRRHFTSARVSFESRNILPCFVIVAEK